MVKIILSSSFTQFIKDLLFDKLILKIPSLSHFNIIKDDHGIYKQFSISNIKNKGYYGIFKEPDFTNFCLSPFNCGDTSITDGNKHYCCYISPYIKMTKPLKHYIEDNEIVFDSFCNVYIIIKRTKKYFEDSLEELFLNGSELENWEYILDNEFARELLTKNDLEEKIIERLKLVRNNFDEKDCEYKEISKIIEFIMNRLL